MNFDREIDGDDGDEDDDRVPAAEAARHGFFRSSGEKMLTKEEKTFNFKTIRGGEGEGGGGGLFRRRQQQQQRQSASFATTPMQQTRVTAISNSPAKKTASSSFLTQTPGQTRRTSEATHRTTQNIPKSSSTTSSLPETIAMIRPDVPGREQRDDRDDVL